MDNIKINCSFISENITKIRWIPENPEYHSNNKFLTGSWGSSPNSIKLWKFGKNQVADDSDEFVPICAGKYLVKGDVTGLELVDNNLIVISTTKGNVNLLNVKHDSEIGNISELKSIVAHNFCTDKKNESLNCCCSGISIFEQNLASIGEDGRLCIIHINDLNVIQEFDAFSCSSTAVSYINHNEILIGNRMGILKLFDIRKNENPASVFAITCEDEKKFNSATCIAYHPTQKHIILIGSEEGSITSWDLRKPSFPASYLSAHKNGITELQFHKTQPDKLFTASENGELWQWNNTSSHSMNNLDFDTANSANSWLNGERAKNKINVTALITGIQKSINSFDSFGSKIICGSDNEAVYFIENLF